MPTCQHCGNTFETVADLPFHGAGLCTPKTMSTHTNETWTAHGRTIYAGKVPVVLAISDYDAECPPVYADDARHPLKNDDEAEAIARRIVQCVNTQPDLLAALQYAADLIRTARQYFPKSIRNRDKFNLENACATVNKALDTAKAKGQP